MTSPGLPLSARPVAARSPSRHAAVRPLAEDGSPPRYARGPPGDGGCVRPRPPRLSLMHAWRRSPRGDPLRRFEARAWDPPGAYRVDGGWLPGLVRHRRPPWRRRPPQAWGAGAARLRLGVRPTLACRARGAASRSRRGVQAGPGQAQWARGARPPGPRGAGPEAAWRPSLRQRRQALQGLIVARPPRPGARLGAGAWRRASAAPPAAVQR